jgi:hypothetical protein
MRRITIDPAPPDRSACDVEVARLCDLDIPALRVQWQNLFRGPAPLHLPRQLMIRTLAYRMQADRFGDLDAEYRRLLDTAPTPEAAGRASSPVRLRPGTVLTREWNGQIVRVSVLKNGFAWNSEIYASLSKVASAITGTRWNGPRFFGLRDRKGGAE